MNRRAGPRIATLPGWTAVARAFVALVVVMGVMVGCGAGGGEDEAGWFVRYERAWPDGLTESQTVWPDGRVVMRHGEHLERFSLSEEEVAQLRAALEGEVAVGSPEDSPRRTITLGDGTTITAAGPDAGSATELLERLLDRHTLEP